ncbi:MAG: hypothetical protein H7263_12375 [Candidatus Sericytochromatia bacterium]|nr:hypothetical protein [Candidatus Sericytochromatia bacterium]
MAYRLEFLPQAQEDLLELQNNPALQKRFKSVRKALGYLSLNPKHPGLNTHKFISKKGPNGEEVFENNTPGAYRIFWHYGPDKNVIAIITITPHP